jgi:hypothetical protein
MSIPSRLDDGFKLWMSISKSLMESSTPKVDEMKNMMMMLLWFQKFVKTMAGIMVVQQGI